MGMRATLFGMAVSRRNITDEGGFDADIESMVQLSPGGIGRCREVRLRHVHEMVQHSLGSLFGGDMGWYIPVTATAISPARHPEVESRTNSGRRFRQDLWVERKASLSNCRKVSLGVWLRFLWCVLLRHEC